MKKDVFPETPSSKEDKQEKLEIRFLGFRVIIENPSTKIVGLVIIILSFLVIIICLIKL